MSNMYGYNDYHGPTFHKSEGDECINDSAVSVVPVVADDDNDSWDDDEEEEEPVNPLQTGFWMEGDSLAPPCGTAVTTIHSMLEFANVTANDVVYDLGCGDGRVCLEAYARCRCATVGVEVEPDLVERAQQLIQQMVESPTDATLRDPNARLPRIIQSDLRQVLRKLVARAVGDKDESEINTGGNDDELPTPTVLVLYLLPEAIQELQSQFEQLLQVLPPPFRILCNTWGLRDRPPFRSEEVPEQGGAITSLYLYTKESMKDA